MTGAGNTLVSPNSSSFFGGSGGGGGTGRGAWAPRSHGNADLGANGNAVTRSSVNVSAFVLVKSSKSSAVYGVSGDEPLGKRTGSPGYSTPMKIVPGWSRPSSGNCPRNVTVHAARFVSIHKVSATRFNSQGGSPSISTRVRGFTPGKRVTKRSMSGCRFSRTIASSTRISSTN